MANNPKAISQLAAAVTGLVDTDLLIIERGTNVNSILASVIADTSANNAGKLVRRDSTGAVVGPIIIYRDTTSAMAATTLLAGQFGSDGTDVGLGDGVTTWANLIKIMPQSGALKLTIGPAYGSVYTEVYPPTGFLSIFAMFAVAQGTDLYDTESAIVTTNRIQVVSVNDGNQLSGMRLLGLRVNNPAGFLTTLNGSISATATTIAVNSTNGLSSSYLLIGDETLHVTGTLPAGFTVERGAFGSTAAIHAQNAFVAGWDSGGNDAGAMLCLGDPGIYGIGGAGGYKSDGTWGKVQGDSVAFGYRLSLTGATFGERMVVDGSGNNTDIVVSISNPSDCVLRVDQNIGFLSAVGLSSNYTPITHGTGQNTTVTLTPVNWATTVGDYGGTGTAGQFSGTLTLLPADTANGYPFFEGTQVNLRLTKGTGTLVILLDSSIKDAGTYSQYHLATLQATITAVPAGTHITIGMEFDMTLQVWVINKFLVY